MSHSIPLSMCAHVFCANVFSACLTVQDSWKLAFHPLSTCMYMYPSCQLMLLLGELSGVLFQQYLCVCVCVCV